LKKTSKITKSNPNPSLQCLLTMSFTATFPLQDHPGYQSSTGFADKLMLIHSQQPCCPSSLRPATLRVLLSTEHTGDHQPWFRNEAMVNRGKDIPAPSCEAAEGDSSTHQHPALPDDTTDHNSRLHLASPLPTGEGISPAMAHKLITAVLKVRGPKGAIRQLRCCKTFGSLPFLGGQVSMCCPCLIAGLF